MRATTGSEAEFMRQQEAGGERVSQKKHGLSIPTGYASGQSMREKRTKAVQDRFRLNKLTVGAKKGPKKFVLLKRKRSVGLFHITGQKGNRKLNRVYDLSHRSVSVPRNPMLQRALKRLERDAGRIQAKAMAFQLRRGRG